MKKKYILLVLLLFMILGCDKKMDSVNEKEFNLDNSIESNEQINTKEENNFVKVVINENEYILNLENSETVRKFVDYLPQNLEMMELNGNEKYIYLDKSFPTNSFNPKKINAGDVMLYGDNCLVIFYKTFDTSYSYTKIGHIDNLPDLGNGNIIVKFDK